MHLNGNDAPAHGWHREDIKAGLRKIAGPITLLSERWGYARGAITHVLERPLYSIPLERLIAETLGVPLHELWPDRWSPEGRSLPRTIDRNPSRVRPAPHRKISEAA